MSNIHHLSLSDGRQFRYFQPCTILIGRDPSCNITFFGDTTISRFHCFFTVDNSGENAYLGDGHPIEGRSKNGFFLNGIHYVQEKTDTVIVLLKSQDMAFIGNTRITYTKQNVTVGDKDETLGSE